MTSDRARKNRLAREAKREEIRARYKAGQREAAEAAKSETQKKIDARVKADRERRWKEEDERAALNRIAASTRRAFDRFDQSLTFRLRLELTPPLLESGVWTSPSYLHLGLMDLPPEPPRRVLDRRPRRGSGYALRCLMLAMCAFPSG